MSWLRIPTPSRFAHHAAAILALAALAMGAGCNHHGDQIEVVAETDEKQYQYAEQMLKEDRQTEALAAFQRVINKRPDDAPESHLEAGRLCIKLKNDPIEAIYHYQKYLAAKPNSEQAPMVRGLIDTAKKEFARSLPGQPYHGEYERLDLIDQIRTLTAQNDELRRELATGQPGPAANPPANQGVALASLPPTPQDNIAAAPLSPLNSNNSANTAAAQKNATKSATAHSYTVEGGDTLSRISSKVYGTKNRWKDILEANSDQLKSAKDLKPGQVLKIPQ
jgi:LysM repeat protein